jgi:hypothetical protein
MTQALYAHMNNKRKKKEKNKKIKKIKKQIGFNDYAKDKHIIV